MQGTWFETNTMNIHVLRQIGVGHLTHMVNASPKSRLIPATHSPRLATQLAFSNSHKPMFNGRRPRNSMAIVSMPKQSESPLLGPCVTMLFNILTSNEYQRRLVHKNDLLDLCTLYWHTWKTQRWVFPKRWNGWCNGGKSLSSFLPFDSWLYRMN